VSGGEGEVVTWQGVERNESNPPCYGMHRLVVLEGRGSEVVCPWIDLAGEKSFLWLSGKIDDE
jgi:hypothetical protein